MSKKAFFVLIYVLIWGVNSILIKHSQAATGEYPYDIALMGLNIELVKLVLSLGWFFMRQESKGSLSADAADLQAKSSLAKWFAIPAGIYCLANALQFVNINQLTVPTYRVLINMRIIFSGLLLQWFFSMKLTRKQWLALCILILGCTTEQLGSFDLQEGGLFALSTMCFQAFCSALGGIYFQWLLQKQQSALEVGLVEKNIFLYSWMCLMNFAFIALFRPNVLSFDRFILNYSPSVLPIVFVGALGGFTTSLLLKHLDVVAKEYANSLEMVFVAVMSSYIFGTTISVYMILGILFVIISVIIYNREEQRVEAHVKGHEDEDEDDDFLATGGVKDMEQQPLRSMAGSDSEE